MEHISAPLGRAIAKTKEKTGPTSLGAAMKTARFKAGLPTKVRDLAPLDPDAFLCWVFHREDVRHEPWEAPLTVEDIAFQLGRDVSTIRRDYVRIAALARRNQRLGLDPLAEDPNPFREARALEARVLRMLRRGE